MLKEMMRMQAELDVKESVDQLQCDLETALREWSKTINQRAVVKLKYMLTAHVLGRIVGKNTSPDYTRELNKIVNLLVTSDPSAPPLDEAIARLEDACRV